MGWETASGAKALFEQQAWMSELKLRPPKLKDFGPKLKVRFPY